MTDYKKLLIQMTEIMSVSGFEKNFSDKFLPLIDGLFEEAFSDDMGNIILRKDSLKKNAPTIMLDAHFDEIGFRVSELHDGGFVSIVPSGGIDRVILPASEVKIYGKETIYGVFVSTPPHLAKPEDKKKLPSFGQLLIDTGYDKKELEDIVSVGDPVTYYTSYIDLAVNNSSPEDESSFPDRIAGRGFDDKSCAAGLICAAVDTPSEELSFNVYITLSAKEETRGFGAACTSVSIRPDAAIVTDVNFALTPGVSEDEAGRLGAGLMISMSAVTDRRLTSHITELLRDNNIPVKPVTEASNTGTNATSLVLAGEGVPTAVMSIPLAGMHTAAESISLKDASMFIEAVKLIITSDKLAEKWS